MKTQYIVQLNKSTIQWKGGKQALENLKRNIGGTLFNKERTPGYSAQHEAKKHKRAYRFKGIVRIDQQDYTE